MARLLFVGDAVAQTGFARCTHAACGAADSLGLDVHVLGINYSGDPHTYPYKIYPAYNPLKGGRDPFGMGRLETLTDEINPDVIVLLTDPWHVKGYLRSIAQSEYAVQARVPVIAWLAVDGTNQKGYELNGLAHVVVWTEFAREELIRSGYTGSISIVPLGVDSELFQPKDRSESRKIACPPEVKDTDFVVLSVGRNQPRKRLDLTLQYYSEWVHSRGVDDSWLYLHVAPTGERGCDLISLINYYGLGADKKVILNETEPGAGEAEQFMPYLYSAADLYFSTTKGEGWGLPCLEALACGTHAVVPDWSGLGSWTGREGAVDKVLCSGTELVAPMNHNPYVVGGIMDRDECLAALDHAYYGKHQQGGMGLNKKGIDLAKSLSWSDSGNGLVREILPFFS